jgi:uncharacterized protein YdeI (YjbR/CyaY-like superfamily)
LGANARTLQFVAQKDWRSWLSEHHANSPGIWLKIAKKGSGVKSVSYDEAVETALCYGWIDGQKKPYDQSFWLQKFTPRGPKSVWSKINRAKSQALVKSGKMKPAGLKAIESAKKDGRWEAAYESQSRASIPADFQKELNNHPKANIFFATLNSVNRYAILFRIHHAKKAETRAKRIDQFIHMLDKHEKIYP